MGDINLTAEQCRAARGLLGWSQGDLAEKSGVSRVPLANFEAGHSKPYQRTIEKLRSALEQAGVVIVDPNGLGPGVRLREKG